MFISNLDVLRSNPYGEDDFHIRGHHLRSCKPSKSNDSLKLGTHMMEIWREEVRVLSLSKTYSEKNVEEDEVLTHKGVFIGFLFNLSDLNPP